MLSRFRATRTRRARSVARRRARIYFCDTNRHFASRAVGPMSDDDARGGACESDASDDDAWFITELPRRRVASASDARELAAFARNATRASRALEARALCEVTRALEAKRDERGERFERCERRERELEAAQARMRADVGRFEAFARENEVKRASALRRAREERRANELRDERLEEMRVESKTRADASRALDDDVERARMFESFLARVAASATGGDGFEDIIDVLGRHDTLRRTHESLCASVAESNARVEIARASHERSMKQMEEERLMTTASIARLRQRDEDLRRENGRLRQEAEYRARSIEDKMRRLAEAKMALRDLARRCAQSDRSSDEQLWRELDFVEDRARVLREIATSAVITVTTKS